MPSRILGFDEVGRGSWAGPLVVGAVLIDDSTAPWCEPLADSKQLTKSKREKLAPIILENAATVGLGWVSPLEIDYIGLGPALHLASRRALAKITAPFDEIIIDGTSNFLAETPLRDRVTVLKKADSLIKSVSAASIVAKVARDEYMRDIASDYPDYGFADNVASPTMSAMAPRPIARLSLNSAPRTSTAIHTSQSRKLCKAKPNYYWREERPRKKVLLHAPASKHIIMATRPSSRYRTISKTTATLF